MALPATLYEFIEAFNRDSSDPELRNCLNELLKTLAEEPLISQAYLNDLAQLGRLNDVVARGSVATELSLFIKKSIPSRASMGIRALHQFYVVASRGKTLSNHELDDLVTLFRKILSDFSKSSFRNFSSIRLHLECLTFFVDCMVDFGLVGSGKLEASSKTEKSLLVQFNEVMKKIPSVLQQEKDRLNAAFSHIPSGLSRDMSQRVGHFADGIKALGSVATSVAATVLTAGVASIALASVPGDLKDAYESFSQVWKAGPELEKVSWYYSLRYFETVISILNLNHSGTITPASLADLVQLLNSLPKDEQFFVPAITILMVNGKKYPHLFQGPFVEAFINDAMNEGIRSRSENLHLALVQLIACLPAELKQKYNLARLPKRSDKLAAIFSAASDLLNDQLNNQNVESSLAILVTTYSDGELALGAGDQVVGTGEAAKKSDIDNLRPKVLQVLGYHLAYAPQGLVERIQSITLRLREYYQGQGQRFFKGSKGWDLLEQWFLDADITGLIIKQVEEDSEGLYKTVLKKGEEAMKSKSGNEEKQIPKDRAQFTYKAVTASGDAVAKERRVIPVAQAKQENKDTRDLAFAALKTLAEGKTDSVDFHFGGAHATGRGRVESENIVGDFTAEQISAMRNSGSSYSTDKLPQGERGKQRLDQPDIGRSEQFRRQSVSSDSSNSSEELCKKKFIT